MAKYGKHHNIVLSSAWEHIKPVYVSAWSVADLKHPEVSGRASLLLDSGAVKVSLDPTPEELRALAAALLAVADEQDALNRAEREVAA